MNQARIQILLATGIVAAVVVTVLLVWPKLKSSPVATAAAQRALTTPPATAAPSAAPPTANAADPQPTNAPAPRPVLERERIRQRWPDWVSGNYRDPFQVDVAVLASEAPREELTPARHLKLQGTWVQIGSRLAVIDRGIYGIGDQVAGYTVVQIESGRVDLRGPDTTETITFYTYVPPPPPRPGGLINTNLIEKLLGPERETLRN